MLEQDNKLNSESFICFLNQEGKSAISPATTQGNTAIFNIVRFK